MVTGARILLCEVKVGRDVLVTTDLLSQNTDVGPSIGTPIILRLYCRPFVGSIPVRIATISDPNVLDLKVL